MTTQILRGIVFTGVGKGTYYTSLPEYRTFFERILGRRIALGTLNVRVIEGDSKQIKFDIYDPGRGLGAVLYKLAMLRDGEKILVIRPLKTIHDDDVLEIVAPYNLRKKYGLHDGSTIELLFCD